MGTIPNMFNAAIVFIIGIIISIFLFKPLAEMLVGLAGADSQSTMLIYVITFLGMIMITFVYGFITLKKPE